MVALIMFAHFSPTWHSQEPRRHRSIHLANAKWLGGADKFEPVSRDGDIDRAEKAVGQLILPGGAMARFILK